MIKKTYESEITIPGTKGEKATINVRDLRDVPLIQLELNIIYKLQNAIYNFEEKRIHKFLRYLFGLRGIEYLVMPTNETEEYYQTDKFKRAGQVVRDSKEATLVLGEAGYTLLESIGVGNWLMEASKQNNAKIDFLYGPRLEPKSDENSKIFHDPSINFYRILKYHRHHFLIVRTVDDKDYLFEEGTHYETLFGRDQNGKQVYVLKSRIRFYYLFRNPVQRFSAKRIMYLKKEALRRKALSVSVPGRIDHFPNQVYSPSLLLKKTVKVFWHAFVTQRWALLLNLPLDRPISDVVRYQSWFGKKPMQNEIINPSEEQLIKLVSSSNLALSLLVYLDYNKSISVHAINKILGFTDENEADVLNELENAELIKSLTDKITLTLLGSSFIRSLYPKP